MWGVRSSINMNTHKQWWAPVWTGLVMDTDAQHYQKMKSAIWLFLYLVLNADRANGSLVRKVKTIILDMGVKRGTILRWLNTLRKEGYITTHSTGRYLHIQIKKWKNLPGVRKIKHQKSQISNFWCLKNPTSQKTSESQKNPILRGNSAFCSPPNDRTIKKDILKNDNDNEFMNLNSNAFKQFKPRNESDLLAVDMATMLHDEKNLALYRSYCKKYPSSLLRKVMDEVKQLPHRKIKKSRGALFNYLVQTYAKKNTHHNSD